MPPFDPLFRNPHLQTIAAHYWPRPKSARRFPVSRRLFRTEPGIQVLVESQRPSGDANGELVLVHGLEGSGEAAYVESMAGAALERGYGAHRFHMRTCGGTEQYADTLYHAGLTSDLLEVVRTFRGDGLSQLFLVGFSLGGNVVLKLAGELEDAAAGLVRGVCGVSTPLDLAACAQRIDAAENFLYQLRFVRRMRARLRATGRYEPPDFAGLRTVRDIDDRITAPSFGFGDAANYYRTQSAVEYVDKIRVPVLLIQAKDDPLVPFGIFERVRENPRVRLVATDRGGHLGFVGKRPHRFWLDEVVMEWVETVTANR